MKVTPLTFDSVIDFCEVLDAIGVESLTSVFKDVSTAGGDLEKIGIAVTGKLVAVVVKNIRKARTPLLRFVAGCLDDDGPVSVETVAAMKATDVIMLTKDILTQPDITDFFTQVSGLLGMGRADSQMKRTGDMAA